MSCVSLKADERIRSIDRWLFLTMLSIKQHLNVTTRHPSVVSKQLITFMTPTAEDRRKTKHIFPWRAVFRSCKTFEWGHRSFLALVPDSGQSEWWENEDVIDLHTMENTTEQIRPAFVWSSTGPITDCWPSVVIIWTVTRSCSDVVTCVTRWWIDYECCFQQRGRRRCWFWWQSWCCRILVRLFFP